MRTSGRHGQLPGFRGAWDPQSRDYWVSEGRGKAAPLGFWGLRPAAQLEGTLVEKCGRKADDPCHVPGSPCLGSSTGGVTLSFPGHSPQWFLCPWKGGRRRVCPRCGFQLCWMAGPDTESQKSDVSSLRSLGPGPGARALSQGPDASLVDGQVWERGTPAGVASRLRVPRESCRWLLPVQVDRSSHVDRAAEVSASTHGPGR